MKQIGLLSDTHGFIEPKLYEFFANCDEIWHAGDFGNLETADKLVNFKPLRGVFGNIDDHRVRAVYKQNLKFQVEDVYVFMTHIGGYPGHYDYRIRTQRLSDPPTLFISGHSHILRVMYDKKIGTLHINPGAIGNHGFHKVKTAVRFVIDGKNIKDLEVLEIDRKQ